jgi:hypothetical protein
MRKKGPEKQDVVKPTKTTVSVPADLYAEMWFLMAGERGAGRKLTAQEIMIDALRDYLHARKQAAAA